jgi:lipopolysaccharide/colanic/teichoic acid biosynthesis glycosyltransferase
MWCLRVSATQGHHRCRWPRFRQAREVVVAASRLARAVRRQHPGEQGEAITRLLWIKRGMDVAVASIAGILVIPLMLIIAGATKLGPPGPVLWRQRRIGLDGRPFTIYKFRTLTVVPGSSPSESEKDVRVTSVGRVLRALSLYELPLLWNVLRGDMSLVGPHPLAVEQSHIAAEASDFRYRTRPGLTGWWQISGRSDLSP